MTRSLKVLGLALAAVLAMSAFASAADFRSPSATTTIHVVQINENTLGTTAGSVTCSTATFHAVMTGTVQSSIQTSEMSFSGCHIIILGSTVSATLSTNGCNLRWNASGTVDLVCPAGAAIEYKAAGCILKIPGQTGLKGLSYTNNGNHIDININVTGGLKYTHSGFLCGTGEGTNGTYSGKLTIEGKNTSGTVVNLDYS